MHFIDKADCKQFISDGSLTLHALSTYKIKSIFLLTFHFSADSCRYSWM